MNEEKMIACPFCGGTTIKTHKLKVAVTLCGFEMLCDNCESTGPFGDTEQQAIERWNDRAGDRQPATHETGGTKGVGISDLLAAVEEVVNHYQIIRASDRKPTTLYLQDKANEEKLWKLVIKLNLLKVEWEKAANVQSSGARGG